MPAKQSPVAIIGGGITGLFCAYVLIRQGYAVDIYEASDRVGGRIRTIRLDNNNKEVDLNQSADSLDFYAEFGPMRIELDKQLLLAALLDHLDIKDDRSKGEPYLIDFPEYASPGSKLDPQYQLRPEENNKTPLQLLRLALLRIVTRLQFAVDANVRSGERNQIDNLLVRLEKLTRAITLAKAVDQEAEPVFNDWMKDELKEEDYWVIQKYGKIGDVCLYNMGFWNLLSDYLSHDAITKVRDQGTFYHLLPENPNAAEWLVWWLRGFSITTSLKGIYGGMEYIVHRLENYIQGKSARNRKFRLFKNTKVTSLHTNNGMVKLNCRVSAKPKKQKQPSKIAYSRVIMALPRQPMEMIWNNSDLKVVGADELTVPRLLESNFGFPMVKTFFVVKNRWWEQETRANWYATRIPTRELHYWKGRSRGSNQGMIMMYTDRPASAFWSNYANPGEQLDVARKRASNECDELQDHQHDRLVSKAAQYMLENDVPNIKKEDIVWCGIRDWGRKPYGGANHAWKPERKYWVAMAKLGQINAGNSTLHVCGEAYSDYHGFIEGSLRSAVYTLHKILDTSKSGNPSTVLKWLSDGSILNVDETYMESLKSWVTDLDRSANSTLTDFESHQ